MYTSDRWIEVRNQAESVATELFSRVEEAVVRGKEGSTVKQYSNYFEAFSKWCKEYGFGFLPASPVTVALYLVHVVNNHSVCGKSKLNTVFYSINWAHIFASAENPCKDEWLKMCLNGCIRMTSKPINRKEPVSPDILQNFIARYASENSSLLDLRISCLLVIMFAGFFRISEVLSLKRSNISFYESYCEIFVEKSKTDVLRDGNVVVIAKTGNSTCPVELLLRYLHKAEILPGSDEFIFRSVHFCKRQKRHVLRKDKLKPMSYSNVRDHFKCRFAEMGFDPSLFGLHSFRSGAATASVHRASSERLWQRHGRWKSVTARDGYVKDSLKDRLSVSLNLGL